MDTLPEELIRKILSYNNACIFSNDCGLCFSNTFYIQFLKCKLLDYKDNHTTGKYKNIDIFNQTCYILNTRKECPFCKGYNENMIFKISRIIFSIYSYENCGVKIYPTPYWEVLDFDTKEELQDCLKLIHNCQKVKIKRFNYQKNIYYCLDNKGIKIRPKLEYNLNKLCSAH